MTDVPRDEYYEGSRLYSVYVHIYPATDGWASLDLGRRIEQIAKDTMGDTTKRVMLHDILRSSEYPRNPRFTILVSAGEQEPKDITTSIFEAFEDTDIIVKDVGFTVAAEYIDAGGDEE